jgi:hypothetical protein
MMPTKREQMAERVALWPRAIELVQSIYSRGCDKGCLHIVLDDDNIKDKSVEFCIGVAEQAGHADCLELARLLLKLSKTQRIKLGDVARRVFPALEDESE